MKSYLRFLGRNRLYTAIEITGLSIALAFVLLLANVVINDLDCDRMIRDKDNLYLCRCDDSPYYKPDANVVFPMIPDITDWCNVQVHDAFDGKTQYIHTPDGSFRQDIKPLTVRENYFDFFGLELIYGDPKDVLEVRNGAVVSESLANTIWQGRNPVGETLILTEARMKDVELVVTGVYKDYKKATLPDTGLAVRFDFITETENLSDAIPSFMGSITPTSLHFVRLRKGADIEAIEKFLWEHKDSDPHSDMPLYKEFELQPYSDMHYDERLAGRKNLYNITDKGLHDTFVFACMILLAFAALNYISLTMAFSRFRVKEMATRQLLGTSKTGIMKRCIAEAGLLVTGSWLLAVAIAFALQKEVSSLLGVTVALYRTSAEWIFTFALLAVITVAAGIIPSSVMSRYNPVEVVKGESRHRDKVLLGKIFIGLEGILSIASVAITIAIYAQTYHMVNTPMGYETEGLLYVDFGSYKDQKFEDELRAQSYVDTIGHIYAAPTRPYASMQMMMVNDEMVSIKQNDGDETAFRLLGLEIIEDYGTSTINRYGDKRKKYLCETTVNNLLPHIKDNHIATGTGKGSQFDGIIKDFRMGNVKDAETSAGYSFTVRDPMSYDRFLVKVNCDEEEAVEKIRELYSGLKPQDQQPSVDSLTSLVEENYKEERRTLAMVGVFAILSILMTMMAIIALSGYYARMQTKDVAIRKSFGCSRRKIFTDMTSGFIWPVIAGAAVAIPSSWLYIRHWLDKYPVRIENGAWIYVCALAVILVIVGISIASQAARLMNTDPAAELKKE